jgi:hypothetical protein
MMDINDMRSRLQADPPYPRLMEHAFALLAEVERLRGDNERLRLALATTIPAEGDPK